MDKNIEFIDSSGKIIVFLMLLFSIFLYTVKSQRKLPNQLFATFLLITAFDLTGLFLGNVLTSYPNLQVLKASSSLLQMPAFYLYVLSVCYSDFTIKPKHAVHTALFFLFLLILKINSLSSQGLLYFKIVGEVQYFAYIIAIFYALKKYKTVYLENYSNLDYTSYNWLFQATSLFCVAHSFVLVKTWIPYFQNDRLVMQNLYVLISISALFIICWFVLKALYSPHLFTGISTSLAPIESTGRKRRISVKQDINTDGSIKRLISYMEREKPYLDFELTLQKLASQMGMPEKELSLLINHHLGKHFFDFVNEYRIDEAKAILENPTKKELTVLEVLYQVGFNSKSSFYTAFKKVTNQTPTDYRKSTLSA